jgi:hypothetical protein
MEFLDAEEMPATILPVGQSTTKHNQLIASMSLIRDQKEFRLQGPWMTFRH